MKTVLDLDSAERILVVCPHPDDESLAAGGLLARASRLGAAIRITYVTSGDNNPWAQRATERRLFIRLADRERFGQLRREEVRAALRVLGLQPQTPSFLPFPDQGLTRLLLAGSQPLRAALAAEIEVFRPSLLVAPSLLDRHPDHSAVGALLDLLLQNLSPSRRPSRVLRYLIHDPEHSSPRTDELTLHLAPSEQQAKREAIACHRSQAFWRGSWLSSFATPQERYLATEPAAALAAHPIRRVRVHDGMLAFEIDSGNHWRAFGRRTLYLIAAAPVADMIRLGVPIPSRRGRAPVLDLATGGTRGEAHFDGAHGRGILELPNSLLQGSSAAFAKVEHRFGFFDEAGWKPVPLARPAAGLQALRTL